MKNSKKARTVNLNKIEKAQDFEFEGKDRLDTQEAHLFLGCSLPLVYAMVRDGRIKKKHYVGNRMLLEKSELQALKKSGAVQPRKKHNTATLIDNLAKLNGDVKVEISIPATDFQVFTALLASQNMKVDEFLQTWARKLISEKVAFLQKNSKSLLKVA